MQNKSFKNLAWGALVFIAVIEFVVMYYGDLPPGFGFSVVPLKEAIASNNSLFVDGAIESNFNLLLTPILYVSQIAREIAYLMIIYILAFISVSYSVEYFFTRYVSEKVTRREIFLVQISTSIPFTMSYYFSGAQFFGYSFFIALLPFGLTVFDRVLSQGEYTNLRSIFTNSIILGAMAALLVVDTRTLLYTALIVFAFSLYAIVLRWSFRKLIRILETLSLSIVIFILINMRFFISILLLRNDGVQAIGDVVPVQLFIAYMSYHFYYALTGSANWNTVYNSKYVILGLIAFLVALVPLLKRKIHPIILFLTLIIFILLAYSTTLAPLLNYYLGQTPLYPYLVYTYATYVFNILYDPFLYLMFGIGLLTLMFYAKKLKRKGTVIGVIIIVAILATQVVYLYPEATAINSGNRTVPVPGYITVTSGYIYSSNLSGNTLVIANYSIESNHYLSFPNAITSDTGWNGWLLSYPDYLMSVGFPDFARAMTYFGVQYIVYNALNYSGYLNYLSGQRGLINVLNSGPIHVYYNTYYEPMIRSHSGFYVAYNVPNAIEYLSMLNVTVPIVPFYTINNFSPLIAYSAGAILPQNDSGSLASLYANSSDSYIIAPGSMTINQVPFGWQISPVIFLGDQLNAIFESDSMSPVPLNIKASVPQGSYFVYVEGGVSVSNQYGSASEGFNISSGNQSVEALFNQTSFAPMISESYAGILNITTKSLEISPTSESGPYEPFISKITLIPVKNMGTVLKEVNNFSNTHLIVQYPANLSYRFNFSSSLLAEEFLAGENGSNNLDGSITVDFTHENMGFWSYEQPLKVSGEIFSSSYYYGLYNLYVSKDTNPSLTYIDSSGTTLIYSNVIVDAVIAVVFFYLKKRS